MHFKNVTWLLFPFPAVNPLPQYNTYGAIMKNVLGTVGTGIESTFAVLAGSNTPGHVMVSQVDDDFNVHTTGSKE